MGSGVLDRCRAGVGRVCSAFGSPTGRNAESTSVLTADHSLMVARPQLLHPFMHTTSLQQRQPWTANKALDGPGG
jgi:hypothetical protein